MTQVLTDQHVPPPRKPTDHKGCFGHVLIIGGDSGMGGAVCLAAEAALRCGSGLVTVITRPEHVSALLGRCPEAMCLGISNTDEINHLLWQRATVCIIGPGMNESTWSQHMWEWFLSQSPLPSVIDAGALTLLAKEKNKPSIPCILTPHPGEAAKLLNISVKEIQNQRLSYAKRLQEFFNNTIVLKGADTLICSPESEEIYLNEYQNPAMATAGMGDVLSGIIGALLAQGCTLFQAASQGVWLQTKAAKYASNQSHSCCLLARDLLAAL